MANRNSNAHFSLAPQVGIERSTFDRSCDVKTSWNVGEVIPFFVDEILPGDTYRIRTSKVVRLQTLITPVMDNLYLDTYYFFVPNRIIWDNWESFIGGNFEEVAWEKPVDYSVPMLIPPYEGEEESDVNGWITGTIADYMGIPVGVYDEDKLVGVNALPFRAYAKIIEDWFRDENLQDPIYIYTGDSATDGVNTRSLPSDYAAGGLPFIANKYHDYFTSCLPKPQKGPEVPFLDGYARVYPLATGNGYPDRLKPYLPNSDVVPMHTRNTYYNTVSETHAVMNNTVLGTSSVGNIAASSDETITNPAGVYIDNLFADLSTAAALPHGMSTTSINSLRQAFQIQRLLEKDARGGSARYIEVLKVHFGVTSPDARLQRAEYLGGNRVPFNIEQVLQTSSSDATTPQGNVAGWSQTNDTSYDVEKSFVEHGWIIGLMCARYDHSYQQGLERQFCRRGRFDYYWPVLAHLGEKAVFKSEIYWNGKNQYIDDNESFFMSNYIFGYQEAWAEYRYKPNYITGQMRSQYSQSLDFWHFGDVYDEAPSLSAAWMQEEKANVDRTLAVSSDVANQIFADIYIDCKATRPMPLYSIPGFIDHF